MSKQCEIGGNDDEAERQRQSLLQRRLQLQSVQRGTTTTATATTTRAEETQFLGMYDRPLYGNISTNIGTGTCLLLILHKPRGVIVSTSLLEGGLLNYWSRGANSRGDIGGFMICVDGKLLVVVMS